MFVYVRTCIVSYICHIESFRTSMRFLFAQGQENYINSVLSLITDKTKSGKFRICFKTESVIQADCFISWSKALKVITIFRLYILQCTKI
jgi:hypothetical protein